jgi:predicted phosphoribosyltransferase
MSPRFADRIDAGQQLAAWLLRYAQRQDVVVLGLPRGGVEIGYQVARALNVPLDIITVRKLGVPGHEELAMGAIAAGGVRVLHEDLVRSLGIPPEAIRETAAREEKELRRREAAWRAGRPALDLEGRTVIVVDDGLATGSTMRAALQAVKAQRPGRVVLAVPVGAEATVEELRPEVDDLVCLATPEPFVAVGLWYRDFTATTDAMVSEMLSRAPAPDAAAMRSGS